MVSGLSEDGDRRKGVRLDRSELLDREGPLISIVVIRLRPSKWHSVKETSCKWSPFRWSKFVYLYHVPTKMLSSVLDLIR